MSITIGDVNLIQSAIDLEFRVLSLEKLMDKLLSTSQVKLTSSDIDMARKDALDILRGKYPNMGIGKNP